MRKNAVIRIRCITAGILVLAVILLARLYQLQVVNAETFRSEAEAQYVHTAKTLYSRGSIFMTTIEGAHVSAATIKSGFLLAIDPSRITDAEGAYKALSSIVPLDRGRFLKQAGRTEQRYQEIYAQLSREEAAAIEALGISGVQLHRNQWRYYPGEALAARTFGFVGYDGDSRAGLYGLERYYEDTLHRDNERRSVNFFAELFDTFSVGEEEVNSEQDKTGDLVTSIEPAVARTLDQLLREVQSKWNSRLSGGIVINPSTGDIFALGVVPSFDLNTRSGVTLEQFRNPLVESVYELGSIIKPLTMAAGIDSGAVTPESTYYDAGSLELNGETIHNYDHRGRGRVDMQQVLSQSLNTGAAEIVNRMGTDAFRKYFLGLKLGTETGIDLPNEARGLVDNLNSPRKIEYATASFGQGFAVTPIAGVRALATLANGGTLITPHIVQQVNYKDGTTREVGFPAGEQVFSKETTETVTRMLVNVVDNALGGGDVELPNYTVAAKTGTAQIADTQNGGYYEDRFLHSFFGYFPAYEPRFLIFLYTVEPEGVLYASHTLTDPFLELTRFLINYYDIPPDR